MGQYEERLKLLEKYYTGIQSSYGFEMKGNIAARKMENAIKKFAPDLDRESVLGFYDTTVTGNGKNGYIFTDTMVYYLEILDTPRKLRYEDIEDVELIDMGKKDGDNKLRFQMRDGSEVIWTNCGLDKTPLYHFFKDLLDCGDAASAGTKEQVSHEESRKYEEPWQAG